MSNQATIIPDDRSPSKLPTSVLHRPAVQLVSVSKVYGRGDNAVNALRGVTAAFPTGTFTAVMGPSGSGKSTLLHIAAGLDRPTTGGAHIGDTDLGELSETGLTKLRRRRVGFVFQAYNLLPALTVAQNIGLPACEIGGHAIWWAVEAGSDAEALRIFPWHVAARSIATRVSEVQIP